MSHRVLPATIIVALVGAMAVTDAHKPITSPFTYSADVLPILRERCGQCHAPGGVAPMSLLTHGDAVPWGESMRIELSAGHMPPWTVDRGAQRLKGPKPLTARELNVLLTWATGGTPPGDAVASPEPPAITPTWKMGTPDVVIDLPTFTIATTDQERVAEFIVPVPSNGHVLRAVDLLPGTPALVRSATIEADGPESPTPLHDERVLALWVPGDAIEAPSGGAFRVGADSKLRVRVRYRKTWSYEGKTMTDVSRIGLYFAPPSAPSVRAVTVSPQRPITLPQAMHAIAVYGGVNGSVTLTAIRPGGRREELIAFHPRAGWTRRFWFREPIALPRGTTLAVRMVPDPPSLMPAGVVAAAAARAPQATGPVTVNLVP